MNALTGTSRAIVSPIAGTTRDAVDEVMERDGHSYRFIDTAGIRRKGKTELMAEKLSVVMARKHLEGADVALMLIDATEGVTAGDATIAGYAHESGRSVIIVINKWDLVSIPKGTKKAQASGPPKQDKRRDSNPRPTAAFTRSRSGGISSFCRTLRCSSFRRQPGGTWTRFSPRWSWWRASGASASARER